jgi:hypothetical protein
MSDEWQYFPCTIGESRASIFLDVGIAKSIDAAPPHLANIRLEYREPREDGLPTSAEFDAVSDIETQLESFTSQASDWYVGRTTYGGARTFYVYTTRQESAWLAWVAHMETTTGYSFRLAYEEDRDHRAYRDELYPTEDDWRVIRDLGVIEHLREHGDDGSESRRVDHWLYFASEADTVPFVAWAVEQGFVHDPEFSGVGEDGRYCLRLHHEGPVTIHAISHHTIKLSRQARACGADYDGWETPVITPDG